MIKISEIRPSKLPVSVEIDPYIPLVVRTFTAPIGAVFFRVGNFDTSLVEVPIDPNSGLLRGIKLVSIDRVGSGIADDHLLAIDGLPVVSSESIPTNRQDDRQEVAVRLMENRFFLDWSNGRSVESKATHGRLTFFIGMGTLLGAAIEKVTENEAQQLRQHLTSVTRSSSS